MCYEGVGILVLFFDWYYIGMFGEDGIEVVGIGIVQGGKEIGFVLFGVVGQVGGGIVVFEKIVDLFDEVQVGFVVDGVEIDEGFEDVQCCFGWLCGG